MKLRIWWHLLKNSLMQNFIFCDVRILVIGDSESGKTDALLNLIKQQDDHVFYFPANNKSIWFKFREKVTGETSNDGTKDFELIVPLKHLSNFWGTLEILLISCEINLILTWFANCFLVVLQKKFQHFQ